MSALDTFQRAMRRYERRAIRRGLLGAAHQIRIARMSCEPGVIAVRETMLRSRGERPLNPRSPDDARFSRFIYGLAANAVARLRATYESAEQP